jgi:hypothetical protein
MSSQDAEKFIKLQKLLKEYDTKKIRIEEQYKNKKEILTNLVKEIKDMGFEPKELASIITKKEEEIKKAVETFEAELNIVSSKLSKIEG